MGKARITAVLAEKHVPANVELTIDYGMGYFSDIACRCGADNCLEKYKSRAQNAIRRASKTNELSSSEKGMEKAQI